MRRLGVGLLVALLVLFVLGPLVWLSLRAFAESWVYPNLLPEQWTLRWWETVFADSELGSSIRLSFVFAPVTVLVSSVICLPAAYAFARYDFPGRRIMLLSLFATNAFPKMGLFVTIAGLFYSLQIMGTFVGVVVIHVLGTLVLMTWIPAAAFAAVPRSLEEAARDAGAGPIRTFFSVTFPIAAPGILVAMIMAFLASFDEAQGTFLVGTPTYITMPTEMYTLVLNYPEQAAAVFSILLSVPSVLLMMLVRKHVMGGRLAEGFQLR
ncbi:MAG: ABC transporter permease subunit [Nonomuraea sp.]|nr:ABC transporter permease subunit [Nonomuraea sp.]